MSIADKLKRLFPKPTLQKRYLILGLVVYAAVKVYTMYTPDTNDDHWPDKVYSILLTES